MKKYRVSVQLDREFCGSCIGVTWPGFTIGMATEDGANAMAAELNRLDSRVTELDRSVQVQVGAKCKALSRVEGFELSQNALVDWFRNEGSAYGQFGDEKGWNALESAVHALHDLTVKNKDLSQLCEKRGTDLAAQAKVIREQRADEQKLVTAIRESQRILADYVGPDAKSPGSTLNALLEVLDHRDLVTLVQGGACGNSEKATPGEPYLEMLSSKPTDWPHWATHLFRDEDGWQFGKLFTGDFGKAWYDSDTQATASRMWTEQNIIDGTMEERPSVTLKTATNGAGQQYVSGFGLGVEPAKAQFLIDGDKVYINTAEILDRLTSVISETQLAPMITTNHFAPEPKASKKQLAALEHALRVVMDPASVKSLRKLLKKLS